MTMVKVERGRNSGARYAAANQSMSAVSRGVANQSISAVPRTVVNQSISAVPRSVANQSISAVPRGVAVVNEFNRGNRNSAHLSMDNFGQVIASPGSKQNGSTVSSRGTIPRPMTAPCSCMDETKCCETCAAYSPGLYFDQDSTGPLDESSCCTYDDDDVAEITVRSSSSGNRNGLRGHRVHRAPEVKDQVVRVATLPPMTLKTTLPDGYSSHAPRTDISAHHRMPGCHQSQSGRMHVQMEPGYLCTSLPIMEGTYEASVTQQVHGPMSPSAGWTLTAPDHASFGGPIASSTPTGKMAPRVVQQCMPEYRSLAVHATSWHGANTEQLPWMPNMASLPSAQNTALMYNHSKTFHDGAWNSFPDTIGRPYMYIANQDTPLDMSPTSRRAMRAREQNNIHPRPSPTSKTHNHSKRESVKRSLNKISLETDTDSVFPIAKAAKSSEKKPANCRTSTSVDSTNFRTSTNVHTLKPRHIVSWYIDHLLQENEDITNISKSSTWQEVSIFQSKDLYFMEPLIKRSGFPSSKFLSWMQENFPNINIRAVDFTEGRQIKCRASFEADLDCKTQSEIINDTFLYFQRIQSGKT